MCFRHNGHPGTGFGQSPLFWTLGQLYWPLYSCIHSKQGRVLYFGTELTQMPEPNVPFLSFSAYSRVRTLSLRCSIGGPLPFGLCRFDDLRPKLYCSQKFPRPCSDKRKPKYRTGGSRNHSAVCCHGNRNLKHGCVLESEWHGLQRCVVWYHFQRRTLHLTSECALACDLSSHSDQRGGPYQIGIGKRYHCRGCRRLAEH
jgi:hypothetical protein